MVLVSLLELFSVFHLLSNIFMMYIMIIEMAVFRSFQIRTLAFGPVSEIVGALHLCLSFLITLFSKAEIQNVLFYFAKYSVDIKSDHGQGC